MTVICKDRRIFNCVFRAVATKAARFFNRESENNMHLKTILAIGLSLATVFAAGLAVGAQPHMQNALRSLEGAKKQLSQADNNKSGHRVKAIELVNQAIAEVKLGIATAN